MVGRTFIGGHFGGRMRGVVSALLVFSWGLVLVVEAGFCLWIERRS